MLHRLWRVQITYSAQGDVELWYHTHHSATDSNGGAFERAADTWPESTGLEFAVTESGSHGGLVRGRDGVGHAGSDGSKDEGEDGEKVHVESDWEAAFCVW